MNALGIVGVCVWCIGLCVDLFIKMFTKIQKYAFTDSFGNDLTIIYSLARWQFGKRRGHLIQGEAQ